MHELKMNITQDIGHGIVIIFMCFMLVSLAVLLDLYTGLRAAKKIGEPIRSHLMRKTIIKIIDYFVIIFLGVLIDILGLCFPWYKIPYMAILITLGVLMVEGYSMLENFTKAKSHAAEVDEALIKILPLLNEIIESKSVKSAAKVYDKIKNTNQDNESRGVSRH